MRARALVVPIWLLAGFMGSHAAERNTVDTPADKVPAPELKLDGVPSAAVDQESTALDPIEVSPQVLPLDAPYAKLHQFGPCLGCGAVAKPKDFFDKYILTGPPLEPTEVQKTDAYVRCSQSGPEMDFICAP